MNRLAFKIMSLLIGCMITAVGMAQIPAKAISYQLEVDLEIFAPDYVDETESDDLTCLLEVDLYYTSKNVRTIVRPITMPSDYNLIIRQRLYETNAADEYNVDHKNKYVLLRKGQQVKLNATKRKKEILGYVCSEFSFTDYRGVDIVVWVAGKLPKNICPAGNFSLKGTALEVITSNGLHYLATDFSRGELSNGFFDVPSGYQQEVVDLNGH